jgi:glutamate carboxypeptidase
MAMTDLVRAVQTAEPRLRQRLRELVEVESPSEDKAAVDRAGELVAQWAIRLGAKVKRHRQRAFGDVLELRFTPPRGQPRRLRAGSAQKPVLLLGHLDTVWPMGTLQRMPWREAEGKLFGPGVLDMKAGVVMALAAIAASRELAAIAASRELAAIAVAREAGAARPVTLLLNSDEEVGSPVSRPITERLARECGAVFVLEPAQGLAYKTARKGVGNYNLHVEGVAAHAGVDFASGHSAVMEMARLIEQVAGFTDLSRGLTVNPGVVRGGTRSNVVAAECIAEVDVRIVRASDAPRVERMFRSLKTTDQACKLTVTGGINRPPMERKAGTIQLFKQAQRLAAEMGLELEEASTGGGSDGNFTAALGVPTLDGMGAVGAGAHAAHEHVVAKHLVERTALLAGMLAARD